MPISRTGDADVEDGHVDTGRGGKWGAKWVSSTDTYTPPSSGQTDGETVETVALYSGGAPKSLQMVMAAVKLKGTYSLEVSYDQPRQHIKKQKHYFANKGPCVKNYGFSSVMYGCKSCTIKKKG